MSTDKFAGQVEHLTWLTSLSDPYSARKTD
jgi:hypothetical protein